jgi:hypothetical protein
MRSLPVAGEVKILALVLVLDSEDVVGHLTPSRLRTSAGDLRYPEAEMSLSTPRNRNEASLAELPVQMRSPTFRPWFDCR